MTDHAKRERQAFLRKRRNTDNSAWWWAIATVWLAVFVILVPTVGPVLFPAG